MQEFWAWGWKLSVVPFHAPRALLIVGPADSKVIHPLDREASDKWWKWSQQPEDISGNLPMDSLRCSRFPEVFLSPFLPSRKQREAPLFSVRLRPCSRCVSLVFGPEYSGNTCTNLVILQVVGSVPFGIWRLYHEYFYYSCPWPWRQTVDDTMTHKSFALLKSKR